MKTLVGLYDEYDRAQETYKQLVNAGFDRNHVTFLTNSPEGAQAGKGGFFKDLFGGSSSQGWQQRNLSGIGPVSGTGAMVDQMTDQNQSLVDSLMDYGVPNPDAQMYAEGLRRGGNLIVLLAEDRMEQKGLQIMNASNPVDLQQRMNIIRQKENWRGFDRNAKPLSADQMENMRIPIIEEELKVGKRQVDQGLVRIHTFVTQQDVQQNVNLRSENVDVSRQPVDRSVNPQDIDAFKENTIEMRETTEEPVVSKDAHVVEEVNINKNVDERQETVHDTVRRTNVDVENAGQASRGRNFEALDPEFRRHYETRYAKSNKDYNQYRDAYYFGVQKAQDSRYGSQDWNLVESKIQQDWEMNHPNMQWAEVRDAVHTGWERAM